MSQIHARTSKLRRGLAVAQAGILMLGLLTMSLPTPAFAHNTNETDEWNLIHLQFPQLPEFPDFNNIPICQNPDGPNPHIIHIDIAAIITLLLQGHLHADNFDLLHCGTPTPPTPQSCVYVSDATTQLDTANYAVAETPNPAWATIDGASWIWGDEMTDAEAAAGSTDTFVKTFALTGSTTATVGLDLASDNGYIVSVNGHQIDDQSGLEHAYNPTHHYDIPVADLVDGNNTLTITVTNLPGGDAAGNPAGLTYKLSVTAATCGAGTPILPPPPQSAHLKIVKHVVNDGGGTKSASDFTLHVETGSETLTDAVTPFAGSEDGTTVDLPAGEYSISEDNAAHYDASFSQNCASGHIHLNPGDEVQCNVTNTYVAPPSCTIVSDDSTQQAGQDSVILTTINGAWTHLLDTVLGDNGNLAKWIWGEEPLADASAAKTETFTKVIHVNGTPDSAVIDFAADNGYQVRVNGTLVGGDHIGDEHNYEGTTTVDILSALTPNADNTIDITVQNLAQAGGTQETNPAGLVYAIHINNSTCSVPNPHQTATIHATKIVCDSESDLPNLQGSHHVTDANTAADFLANHPSCHLQPDWQFEWGNQDAGNPGGSFVGHADGYTSSASTGNDGSVTMTVPVANMSSLHLREILKDGFIPFSDSGDVSAELSCGDDGLNYDNWEWINNPQAGQTYYCVAYNAPKTSDVTLCKYDDQEHPLSGWNLFLKGEHVEDLSVPTNTSAGVNTANALTSGVSYLALAAGTWLNQGDANPVDAEYSTTDNWATHMDGYTGYGPGILELEVNQNDGNWGPYNSDHAYAQSFTASNAPANFRIFDGDTNTHVQNEGWFGDNSGSLAVSLFKGYAGVTDDNGCVTFHNVPYGSYTVGETGQDSWSIVTGTGEKTVDQPTEQFNVVNHFTNPNDGGGETTHSEETVVVQAADLGNDTSDTSKWFFVDDKAPGFDIDNTKGSFVFGPAIAPLQDGSAEITATTTQGIILDTLQFIGTRLDHVASLAYSTYRSQGDAALALALQFDIDTDVTDANHAYQGRLVYEPYYTHAVSDNTWQTWNPMDNSTSAGHGNWWFSKSTIATASGCTQANPCTWSQVLAAFPNIGISGSTDFKAGSNWSSTFTGNIDKFVIGIVTGTNTDTKTFDFEPTQDEVVPTDLCSNIDGPQETVPAGKVRRDDGTCVSSGGGAPQIFTFSSGGDGGHDGKVLGESTTTEPTCTPLLTSYLKMGWKNDPEQVKKLQQFLADHLHITLPTTGFFGPMTHNAVKQFQKGEWENVLKPWVGLPGSGIKGPNTPTGFVYQTTKWRINNIVCQDSESFPDKLN